VRRARTARLWPIALAVPRAAAGARGRRRPCTFARRAAVALEGRGTTAAPDRSSWLLQRVPEGPERGGVEAQPESEAHPVERKLMQRSRSGFKGLRVRRSTKA